jgi:multiple sugar transport system ATP-binding protein
MKISLVNVSKKYSRNKMVVEGLNLTIENNEFIVIIGPSGCGKTTILQMIAGLEEVTEGAIYFNDTNISKILPKDRNIAMVFQNYALYPNMTVYENMEFCLKNMNVTKDKRIERIKSVSDVLKISNILDRKPHQLSGGEKQRVALGRAMVRKPAVFLFDEPLSSLDAKLRNNTRKQLIKLHNKLNTTFIYVTHDQMEAMSLGTRIVVMNEGKIEQVGTPNEIYNYPQNVFVATFLGNPEINIIESTIIKNETEFLINIFEKTIKLNSQNYNINKLNNLLNKRIKIGIRSENILFSVNYINISMEVDVNIIENVGDVSYVYVTCCNMEIIIKLNYIIDKSIKKGYINFNNDKLIIFDENNNSIY